MTGRADIAVRITGVGAELPPDVVTSAEVEEPLRVGLARARDGSAETPPGVS